MCHDDDAVEPSQYRGGDLLEGRGGRSHRRRDPMDRGRSHVAQRVHEGFEDSEFSAVLIEPNDGDLDDSIRAVRSKTSGLQIHHCVPPLPVREAARLVGITEHFPS
jgi:hypothetical protein